MFNERSMHLDSYPLRLCSKPITSFEHINKRLSENPIQVSDDLFDIE